MYIRFYKRTIDLFLLFIFFPLVLCPSIMVAFISLLVYKGKIFFVQDRIGCNNKAFKLYKFKTMLDVTDNYGNRINGSGRITIWGNFLRKYSLDEIPQIINILKGDMSFVGPRPLLPEYLPFYTNEENIRHWVKPGLTSLAQVKGGNNLSWDTRLSHDIKYVKTASFTQDLKILSLTLIQLFKGAKQHFSSSLIEDRQSALPGKA